MCIDLYTTVMHVSLLSLTPFPLCDCVGTPATVSFTAHRPTTILPSSALSCSPSHCQGYGGYSWWIRLGVDELKITPKMGVCVGCVCQESLWKSKFKLVFASKLAEIIERPELYF